MGAQRGDDVLPVFSLARSVWPALLGEAALVDSVVSARHGWVGVRCCSHKYVS